MYHSVQGFNFEFIGRATNALDRALLIRPKIKYFMTVYFHDMVLLLEDNILSNKMTVLFYLID